MKKSIFSFIIVLLLVGSTVHADSVLSLDDILKKVDTSPTIKALDNKLVGMDILYKKMTDLSEKLAQFSFPYITDSQMRANMGLAFTKTDRLAQDKAIYLVPGQTQYGYNVLKKNREAALEGLKLGVEQIYNGIILSNNGIKLQEEIVTVSDEQLKNAEDKYNKGLMSKNDYIMAKLKDRQDKLKLNLQKRSLQNLIYSLNKMVGIDLKTTYDKINENIEELPMPNIDIDGAVKEALNNRVELYSLKEDSKNINKELFFTQAYYSSGDPEYDSLAIKNETNKENIANTEEDIRYELEDASDAIEQNYNNVKKAKSELESANESYKLVKEKYDQGLIPKDILDASHIQVTASGLKLMSAVSTYNMSVKKFEAATGAGPKFN